MWSTRTTSPRESAQSRIVHFKASARDPAEIVHKLVIRPRGGTAGDRHRVLDLEREDEEGLLYGLKPNATGL